MTETPAVEVRHLRFGYGTELVLDDVSLTIGRHDFVAVIGPNGGGKTTLLQVILGLRQPWSGEVVLGVGRKPGRLGYVPQFANFDRDFPLRVLDVVLMGRLGRRGACRRYSRADYAAAERVMERFRLGGRARDSVAGLSGGQLQRALIARALVAEPEILFLDEPLASIDAESRETLLDTLRDLNERIPVVVVTHDLTPFAGSVRQVACINRRLYYHPEGELTSEMVAKAYGSCSVELVAHGLPHRVLAAHEPGDGVRG